MLHIHAHVCIITVLFVGFNIRAEDNKTVVGLSTLKIVVFLVDTIIFPKQIMAS